MFLQSHIQVEKSLTLDIINERIKKFDFGVVGTKNKPSPLKQQVLTTDSATISQTGILHNYIVSNYGLKLCVFWSHMRVSQVFQLSPSFFMQWIL